MCQIVSTENKSKYISSELEDLLKEVEEEHKNTSEIIKNKQNKKEKVQSQD